MTLRLVASRHGNPSSLHSALSGDLTRAECYALTVAIQRLPGVWSTREHRGTTRTLVLLLPRDERDEQAPLFLVWRARGALHLCKGQGTQATDLGRFASVAAVMAAVEREVRSYLAAAP